MAERLYTKIQDGKPVAYAYGEEWVAMALRTGDISYQTEGEARAAWARWRAKDFYREDEEWEE